MTQHGQDDQLIQYMERKGIPVTRDNYLALAFPLTEPDQYTDEQRASVPEQAQ